MLFIFTPFMVTSATSDKDSNAVMNEWATVPSIGMFSLNPAIMFEDPSKPPKYEYLVAENPPSGP